MRLYFNLLIAITAFLITPSAYSAWDRACLDDCFGSHHDCGYCDWFCQVDSSSSSYNAPNEFKKCPFTNSNGELAY